MIESLKKTSQIIDVKDPLNQTGSKNMLNK